MLNDKPLMPQIAVKDVEVAKKFYKETLGLTLKLEPMEGMAVFESGGVMFNVYESQVSGTNQATYAGWMVEDVDAEVEHLKTKGVKFEHYDFPGAKIENDVHVFGETKSAWFKDPDGNILAIFNGS